jgi:lysozyme
VQLIKERGALDLVNSGRVADAIGACKSEWASLPGNSAGQPQRSMAMLIQAYGDHGGAFA